MATAGSVGKYFREQMVGDIRTYYEEARQVIFVELQKLDAFSVNRLRNDLREKHARIFVSKNTLIRKALGDLKGFSFDASYVRGSTGMVFLSGDPVEACKLLADFAKGKESFKIKGGVLDERPVDEKAIKEVAKLPSREVLRGMCVNALAAVLSNCVGVLNNILVQPLLVLQAIREKKEKEQ